MIRRYFAVVHKEPRSAFGVSFPDVPGCVSAGDDLDEALAMAREALGLHLDGLRDDGERLPEPSDLDALGRAGLLDDPTIAAVLAVEVEMRALAAE